MNYYTHISLSYWKFHKKNLVSLLSVMIIGVAALFAAALLIRSEKEQVLEKELKLLGDYDAIIYDISEETYENIQNLEGVSAAGAYYEVAVAGREGATSGAYSLVAFEDAASEEMYHMTCEEGGYPQNENEIAADASSLKKLGIMPEVGDTIILSLFDEQGNSQGEKEYTISGIFEASNATVYDGWYRYPHEIDKEEYLMPSFVVAGGSETFETNLSITAMVQCEDVYAIDFKSALSGGDGEHANYMDPVLGRSYAYAYVLGIFMSIYEEYGATNLDTVIQALCDGKGVKDFYSSVLIPVFVFLIACVSAISIYNVVRISLYDRRKQLKTLRSLGLSGKKCGGLLLAEIVIFFALSYVLGIVLGCGIHYFMLWVLEKCFDVTLTSGFEVSQYVSAVTFNPFILSLIVLCVVTMIASFRPVVYFSRQVPVELEWGINVKKKQRNKGNLKLNFRGKRYSFYFTSIAVILSFVLCSIPFGYVYFRAMADKETSGYETDLELAGLSQYDYSAEKERADRLSTFGVETRRHYGVTEDALEEICGSEYFSDYYAEALRLSTRIVIPSSQETEVWNGLFDEENLRGMYKTAYYDEETMEQYPEFAQAAKEAEDAVIESMGYTDGECIYSMPTIGLTKETLSKLNQYVRYGEVDMDAIQSGEEVLVAVSEADLENAMSCFSVGEELPLEDVHLQDWENSLDFDKSFLTDFDAAYCKEVVLPEGDTVKLASYAFGTRQKIDTKVGAIIVLDESTQEEFAGTFASLISEEGLSAPMVITYGNQVYTSWGLDSSEYTYVAVKLSEKFDLKSADVFWYTSLGSCEGLSIASSYEIQTKIYYGQIQTLVVFYMFAFFLVIAGSICLIVTIGIQLRLIENEIETLRKLGMSVGQISGRLFGDSLIYPVAGVLASLIPISAVQGIFSWICFNIDSGVWEGLAIDDIPWYVDLPYRYNLFSYNLPMVLLVTFLIGVALAFAGMIPQIYRLYKNKMIVGEKNGRN